ncbi:hypothetical protein B0A52_08978 [Exophiala mesophila]|uniref:RecA family profile 1 domain-containing protein n=1 Tax=Exophiala mesophila TaxID=212818 RepID=A0A438MV02_EXOME|nr:hypothetical protein B0A52_08978 [Exophiala mesophila]
MSDLLEVLPDFDTGPFTHLFHSLEKNNISVADLISLEPKEISRKCPLPLADVQKLRQSLVQAMQNDLKILVTKTPRLGSRAVQKTTSPPSVSQAGPSDRHVSPVRNTASVDESEDIRPAHTSTSYHPEQGSRLPILDPRLDDALGGGFRPGHISEIVGESAVGKTQLVLGLLLSVQLPPPRGLGKSGMYISTEDSLNTRRLSEMLDSHPEYQKLPPECRPTMDRVHAVTADNLVWQEHIIRYQLPIAVPRMNIGLVILDSVAANFRAEYETTTSAALAGRAADLIHLGNSLRRIASEFNAVVIVTNQVSDRFDDQGAHRIRTSFQPVPYVDPASSAAIAGQTQPVQAADSQRRRMEVQSLDHQLRFFSGWGSQGLPSYENMKTPALGLAWANQISARLVLKMEHERAYPGVGNGSRDGRRKRSLSIVFAPWTPATPVPIGYEITTSGIKAVGGEIANRQQEGEHDPDLLNPQFWAEDEEFP